MNKYCLVTTTFANETDAMTVVNAAIANKLVACAQTLNIQSHYTWQGKVWHEPEILVLFKTTWDLYPELESKIKDLHPYEVPEIVATEIKCGLSDYLGWIDTVTK